MKLASFLTAATIAQVAYGHTTVWGVTVNGQEQGRGDQVPGYVRKITKSNSPVKDVKSPDMTCNANQGANSKSVNVKGGDKISVIWAHEQRGDDILAGSHKGPVQVYVAPAASNGKGNVWVKVAADGYAGGVWATDKLIKNKGEHSFVMPNVAPGDYLVRPEIIALHEGQNVGGAQFYMECIQVKVTGGGSLQLPQGISFPGTYSATDPGIKFNVYAQPMPAYTIPGGPVWDGRSQGANSQPAPAAALVAAPAEAPAAAPGQQEIPQAPTAPQAGNAGAAPAWAQGLGQAWGQAGGSAPGQQRKPQAPAAPNAGNAGAAPAGGQASGATAAQWAQCGGQNFNGPNACASGLTCKQLNPYYSQCQ